MPRVRKGAARNKARRRMLKQARGYWGTKSRHKQQAKVALVRAGQFAYRDRRARRRDFRKLWILRINAACRMRGTRYSRFINGIQRSGILLNRKMLSQIAIEDPKTFDQLVEISESATSAHGEGSGSSAEAGTPEKKTKTKKKASAPKKKGGTEAEQVAAGS
jgi:large subunit ribosomal protein L20